jgi:hypothetical protein
MQVPLLQSLGTRRSTSQQSGNACHGGASADRHSRCCWRGALSGRESAASHASASLRTCGRSAQPKRSSIRYPQRSMAAILSRSTHSRRRHQCGLSSYPCRSFRYARCMRLGSRLCGKSPWRIGHPNGGISGAISTRTRTAQRATYCARQSQAKPAARFLISLRFLRSARLLRVGLLILDR